MKTFVLVLLVMALVALLLPTHADAWQCAVGRHRYNPHCLALALKPTATPAVTPAATPTLAGPTWVFP